MEKHFAKALTQFGGRSFFSLCSVDNEAAQSATKPLMIFGATALFILACWCGVV